MGGITTLLDILKPAPIKGTPMNTEVVSAELLIQRLFPFRVYKGVGLKGGWGGGGGGGLGERCYVLTDADATQYANDINNLSTCVNDLGQYFIKAFLFFFEMLSCNVDA